MRKLFLKYSFFVVLVFALTLSALKTGIPTGTLQTAQALAAKQGKTSKTMYIGGTCRIKLTDATGTVKYSSSKKSVASVSNRGKVTAQKAGKATITAKVGKKKYTCKIVVKKLLTVSKESVECADKTSVKVTFKGSGTVYYHNNNKSIVDCKWEKWKDNHCKLEIIPKQSGTAKIDLTNDVNHEKVTITVTSVIDCSSMVKNVKNQSVSYAAGDHCQRIFFSLVNADNKEITCGASVAIRIVNERGETVYQKTREITDEDFKYWKSEQYGTALLCAIDIPDSEVTAGSSDKGEVYYTISHGSTFTLGEYHFAVGQLPCSQKPQ